MHIQFSKYQGTGNDFVMLNNLTGQYNQLRIEQIRLLCDRKFGIGADGLIKLNHNDQYAFEVDYFNADGSKSFCGNGARCAVNFAHEIGIDVQEVPFLAIDGVHIARRIDQEVSLDMSPVTEIRRDQTNFVLDTGSPHFIQFVEDLDVIDVVTTGRSIRNSTSYQEQGINVNFVEVINEHALKVYTYERGVEDETLSCGTGVCAAALAWAFKQNRLGDQDITIETKGGKLRLTFVATQQKFEAIRLIGPAEKVYDGHIQL